MQRRVFLFVALALLVPAMALASTIGGPAVVNLNPNQAGQIVTLSLTGNDAYTDSAFSGVIDAGGPLVTAILGKAAPTGTIPAGGLAGTIWAGGFGGTSDYGLTPGAGFLTPGGASQTTAGTYLTLTIDTTSVGPAGGDFLLDISATTLFNGLEEDGFTPIQSENFLTSNMILHVPGVPEPSSVVLGLFAVGGLAAVAIRRRRTA